MTTRRFLNSNTVTLNSNSCSLKSTFPHIRCKTKDDICSVRNSYPSQSFRASVLVLWLLGTIISDRSGSFSCFVEAHENKEGIMGRDMFPIVVREDGTIVNITGKNNSDFPYFIQPAAFGSNFPKSVIVNFMTPPTPLDAHLCQYPESLQDFPYSDRSNLEYAIMFSGTTSALMRTKASNQTDNGESSTTNNLKVGIQSDSDVKIGLLVRRGSCSIEQKVMVMVEMKERLNLTDLLLYLLIYEDDMYQRDQIVTFALGGGQNTTSRNDTDVVNERINSIGIAYLPYKFLMDVEVRIESIVGSSANHEPCNISNIQTSSSGLSPNFLGGPANYNWQMLFRIAGPDEPILSSFERMIHDDDVVSRDDSTSSRSNSGGVLPTILLVLLIGLPIFRTIRLWYMAGGRIEFRRNSNGRIVGFDYIRPRQLWYSVPGGVIYGSEFGHNINHTTNHNHEQSRYSKIRLLTQKEFQTLPEIIYDGPKPLSDDSSSRSSTVTKYRTTKQATASVTNCTKDRSRSNRNSIATVVAHDEVGTASIRDTDCSSSSRFRLNLLQGLSFRSPGKTISNDSSTICSICIDEYQPGDKLIQLPRCKHTFHNGCIHPWLLEQQGFCPLCKTPVINDDEMGDFEGSNDNDEDDDDTNNINNNRSRPGSVIDNNRSARHQRETLSI